MGHSLPLCGRTFGRNGRAVSRIRLYFINQLSNIHLVETSQHDLGQIASALHREVDFITGQLPVAHPIGIATSSPHYFYLLLASRTQSSSDILRSLSQQRFNWWDEFITHGSLDIAEDGLNLNITFEDSILEVIKPELNFVHSYVLLDNAPKGIVSLHGNDLKIHKRLAPYKVAVTKVPDADKSEILQELSDRVCSLLRANGISCIVTEADESVLDSLGVPFALRLSTETLKTGTTKLRDIDVKIWGDVHLGHILQRVMNPISRGYDQSLNFSLKD